MSGLVLKIIAILSMLTDHIAASFGLSFFPPEVYWVMRYIGRTAFPVFCFLIVEGALHTRNPYRYLARLGIFALISEIPFNLAFDRSVIKTGSTNVFFTLFLGLLAIIICRKLKDAASAEIQIAAAAGAVIICCLAAELLHTDYSSGGVLVIISMYFLHDKPAARDAVMLLILSLFFGPVELFGAASIVLFFFYNGRRGKTNRFFQYFFYAFYPLHLTILWILSYCFLY